jgi:hypothetical protein
MPSAFSRGSTAAAGQRKTLASCPDST